MIPTSLFWREDPVFVKYLENVTMAVSRHNPCSPPRLPEADDLIFLLSIVLNPNKLIAEQQPQHQPQQRTTQSSSVRNASSKTIPASPTTWQQKLTSFPTHRRQIILSISKLANAYQKWNLVCAKGGPVAPVAPFHKENHEDIATIATALEEVENTALTIRANIAEYTVEIEGCILSLRQFWLENQNIHHRRRRHLPNSTSSSSSSSDELRYLGRQLTMQLIRQIRWDERLLNAILLFLDKEIYYCHFRNNKSNNAATIATDKLHTWGDAMSKMIQIDKSYWEFAQKEVYIELTESEHSSQVGEVREHNGTHVLSICPPALESEWRDDMNDDNPSYSTFQATTKCFTSIEVKRSIHERIISSTSVEQAIDTFATTHLHHHEEKGRSHCAASTENAYHQERKRDISSFTSILLIGEEGCGKTHFLDTVQERYASSRTNIGSNATPLSSSLQILRPNNIKDLMGNSIGSSEDRLIALFTYASQAMDNKDGVGRTCLIMLDDIDRMFSFSNDVNYEFSAVNSGENISCHQNNVGKNCKALFLTILDSFRNRSWRSSNGHLMLLCTSRSRCSEVVDRFDRIFQRGLPDERRRRDILLSCLSIGVNSVHNSFNIEDDTTEAILSLAVHHSAGKLDCELAQYCREVLLNGVSQTSGGSGMQMKSKDILKERLYYLDRMLQTKTPQSIRGGSLDGIVEMRVYTPDELQSKLVTDTSGMVHLPLLGNAAERALKELMNVVITPLCRSDEIRELLYGDGGAFGGDGQEVGSNTETIVGALLAGGPGVGKTSLVFHCAALAAKMSRVSLLEVSATSLIHKELGGSERAVRRLFTAVRAAAPCILLIDGIESVAPKRGNDNTSEGTMDRVLSTFLTEMDGIESGGGNGAHTSFNIGVIGITHNPKLIDPALLRPGRLQKTITLGVPDYEARKEIVARQIDEVNFDFTQAGYFDAKSKDDISKFVAMESAGMSAAEVIAICREASLVCLRELNHVVTTKPLLTYAHFKIAVSTMKGKSGA